MNCSDARKQLSSDHGSVRGESLAEHLTQCAACRSLAARLSQVDADLGALPAQVPPSSLVAKTLDKVERDAPRGLRGLRLAMAISAPVVLLLVGLGVTFQQESRALFSTSANALAGNEYSDGPAQVPDRYVSLVVPQDPAAVAPKYWVGGKRTKDVAGWESVNEQQVARTEQFGEDLDLLDGRVAELNQRVFHSKGRVSLLSEEVLKEGKLGGEEKEEKKEGEKERSEEDDKSRNAVDGYLELPSQDRLARQARVVPAFKDGKSVGFKVYGVRPDSDLGRLGLRNGDVVETVNGRPLNSPDKALEAYQAVAGRGELEFGIKRQGQEVTITTKLDALEPNEPDSGAFDFDGDKSKEGGQSQTIKHAQGGKDKADRGLDRGKSDESDFRAQHRLDDSGQAEQGRLKLNSEPLWARVVVDGEEVAQDDMNLADLPAGAQRIEIQKKAYRSLVQKTDLGDSYQYATAGDDGTELLDPGDEISGKARVMGSMSRDVISRVMNAQPESLSSCTKNRAADSTLDGSTLRFTIQPNGQTGQAQVIGPASGEPAVADCLVNKVEEMRFPAPKGGGMVVVQTPLDLGESDAAELEGLISELRRAEQPLDQLQFISSSGYFKNTYLPGDPSLNWLEKSLADGLFMDGQRLDLAAGAQGYEQPFDAPADGGLAVYLSSDQAALEGASRMKIQVGIKASDRLAKRRAPLNAVLVVDLRSLPRDADRQALWRLGESLAGVSQAGDRFWLVAGGVAEAVLLEPNSFEPSAVKRELARALLSLEGSDDPDTTMAETMTRAYGLLSSGLGPDAPLGTNLVLLASASSLSDEKDTLIDLAHAQAVEGVATSTLGVGPASDAHSLAELALAGQGRRRLVDSAAKARPVLEAELAASGSVVARAVRLRIRLAEGVRLINVLGSEPLNQQRAERVRQAERSIDQRVAATTGIAADRGEDEEGIQIVIPAFYASDTHVILLDVVAPGPGPVADIQVRYKDLIGLKNSVARARLQVPQGSAVADPRAINTMKNVLAHHVSEDLAQASAALKAEQVDLCRRMLARASARIALLRQDLPQLAEDPELARDENMLAGYQKMLTDHPAWRELPSIKGYVVRSLALAAKRKVNLWQGR